MTDIRELRLAIERKLKHRQRLITENAELRHGLRQSEARNDFLLDALKSPLVNMAIEDCADAIVNRILEEAIKASQAVAEQTIENGDYVVGLDIPSLHIRHRIYRVDLREYNDPRVQVDIPFRRVDYDGKNRTKTKRET